MTMNSMIGIVISPGHDSMVPILHCRIQRGAIHLVRQLLAESHNDILWVIAENIGSGRRLGRQELGKTIVDLLVLGLLGCGRMDTSGRTSRPRTTAIPRYYGF